MSENNGSLDESWSDVIEDFEEVARTFGEAARENRRKQDEAPEPTGEMEGVIRQPTHGHDPNVYLLIPHYQGDEKAPVPRRPDAAPPLRSAAVTISKSGQEVAEVKPDTEYTIEVTVRNVGGNTATGTTVEVFADHRKPSATLDTAPDGVFELPQPEDADAGVADYTGFCTLDQGQDRLYVLGYVPPSTPSNPEQYTPKPENVVIRSYFGGNGGAVGGDVNADRTFSFRDFVRVKYNVETLLMSQQARNSSTFRIRLYDNDDLKLVPPWWVFPETFTVDPSATYLRTSGDDNADDPTPIDLSNIGITPGDTVKLTRAGAYDKKGYDNQGTVGKGLIGVFSKTATLNASGQLNRVPGAIDAGSDFKSPPTYGTGEKTDIPEDFKIANRDGTSPSLVVDVPKKANYLFVSPIDDFFEDNTTLSTTDFRLLVTSEGRKRDEISKTISTLENKGTLLTDTEGRYVQNPPVNNRKGPLDLAGSVDDIPLADPVGSTDLPQSVEIPQTGKTTVSFKYRTPPNTRQPPVSLTAFYARAYSLAAPDDPPNWSRLDHTTSRFVGRTEVTWQ